MTEMTPRYWLRRVGEAWKEATEKQFIDAERSAGFRPKYGDGLATGGFGNETIKGRVTYGKITKERHGNDPDFFEVARNSSLTANATQ